MRRVLQRTLTGLSVATMAFGVASCDAVLGLTDKPLAAGTGGDGGAAPDGGACVGDSTGYHPMKTTACWETFDTSQPFGTSAGGVYGGTFDGHYVYFAGATNSFMIQFDTTMSFTDESAWNGFDASTLGTGSGGTTQTYGGAVYDGRYVYFIPSTSPAFVRYDTRGAGFTTASAWTELILTGTTAAYTGGVYDGHKYIYFAPYQGADGNASGVIARFDTTQGTFTNAAFTYFDTTTLPTTGPHSPTPSGDYWGTVFDGRRIFFIPNSDTVLTVFDTVGIFGAAASWSTYDLSQVDPLASGGYATGAFDGKFVYIAPDDSNSSLQYSATSPLTTTRDWEELFPASIVGESTSNQTFAATGFDGRYVYLAPGFNVNANSSNLNGGLVRYDTTLTPYSAAASWTAFNTVNLLPKGNGPGDFGAAVFDGKYVYFAPSDYPIIARFDAKDTAAMPALPAGWNGSFF